MRKYCYVPSCVNTTANARGKIFITLPKPDEIRKRWLRAVGREECAPKKVFFCQDHFDLENDMENYREYSIMGGRIYMKKEAVPHLMLGENIVMVEPETLLPNENQLDPSIEAVDPLLLPVPLTTDVNIQENRTIVNNTPQLPTSTSDDTFRSSTRVTPPEITVRKYCFVPSCTNSTINSRDKLFITLPRPEEIRKRWLQAVGKEQSSPRGSVYFCQDHFNLEHDMQNYIEHSLMGGRIFMKKNIVPHLMLEANNEHIENPNIVMIEPETLLPNENQLDPSIEAIDPLLLPVPPPSSPAVNIQENTSVLNELSNKNILITTKIITTQLRTSTNSAPSRRAMRLIAPKKSAPSEISLINKLGKSDQIDINKTCRSCLLNTGNMVSLKEPYLNEMSVAEVIASTTSLDISCGLDGLPTQICHDCFCKLHLSHKFVLKFRQSDKKLRNFLNKNIKTTHAKHKPDTQTTSTQTEMIGNDVKLEIIELDPLSDDIHCDEIDLEYQSNNSKSPNDDSTFENNRRCIIDEQQINVSELECEVMLDIKTEDDRLNSGNENLNHGSDEMLEFNQLEALNEVKNEFEEDVIASTSDLEEVRVNRDVQMEGKCRNRKVTNHFIKECHPTESTNNKDYHVKLGSKSFKFYSMLKRRHTINIKTKNVGVEQVKRRFQCAVCSMSFDRMFHLKNHRRMHTVDKPFVCKYCEKKFKYKIYLIHHLKTHTGEKPYLCTFCEKTFKHKLALSSHLKTHTGERPFACKVCNKSFTRLSVKNIHMRIHTGDRPYSCTFCSKSFTQRISLTYHMPMHTGEKSFVCTICSKRFTRKTGLTTHMRLHTGEKPFCCTFCDRSFAHRASLASHKQTHHT